MSNFWPLKHAISGTQNIVRRPWNQCRMPHQNHDKKHPEIRHFSGSKNSTFWSRKSTNLAKNRAWTTLPFTLVERVVWTCGCGERCRVECTTKRWGRTRLRTNSKKGLFSKIEWESVKKSSWNREGIEWDNWTGESSREFGQVKSQFQRGI